MSRISNAIRSEAQKLILRFELYAKWVYDENQRRARRFTSTSDFDRLKVLRPNYWELARGFNPYLVRSSYERIGHSIRRAISDKRYEPRAPTLYEVDKSPPGSGKRQVALFQVADSATSRLIFRNVTSKNLPLFSAHSYAYRRDLTTHDALQHIQSEWNRSSRLFIAEYDFSSFFEGISHEHIRRTLHDYRFLLTPQEESVIDAFLAAPKPIAEGYQEIGGPPRERGIPQGTSISLFLANVAATPLDRSLERLGLGFVRYADDTLIWSDDYAQICRAVEALHTHSEQIGSNLNFKKSKGVRLLVPEGAAAEIKSATRTDFIGYDLRLDQLSIRSNSVTAIKSRLNNLLFENLLRAPMAGEIDPSRVRGKVDRDYVVFIFQARRYLYGDLRERELRSYQRGGVRLRRFKGRMAFYPLVDDDEQLVQLDEWLRTQTWLTMRKRFGILQDLGLATPPPLGLDLGALANFTRQSATTGDVFDLRLPSFQRISNALRAASQRYGPNQVAQGGLGYY